MKKINPRRVLDDALGAITGGAIVGLIVLGVNVGTTAKADAVEPWVQPYGGCKEAIDYPRSPGADDCRDHGWTVTRNIVLTPAGWLSVTDLPLCPSDEAVARDRGCVWYADEMGNHEGRSFWLNRHGVVHHFKGAR